MSVNRDTVMDMAACEIGRLESRVHQLTDRTRQLEAELAKERERNDLRTRIAAQMSAVKAAGCHCETKEALARLAQWLRAFAGAYRPLNGHKWAQGIIDAAVEAEAKPWWEEQKPPTPPPQDKPCLPPFARETSFSGRCLIFSFSGEEFCAPNDYMGKAIELHHLINPRVLRMRPEEQAEGRWTIRIDWTPPQVKPQPWRIGIDRGTTMDAIDARSGLTHGFCTD